ncbi:MAG: metal-dependent transcriptional regulator [Chloroflexi bacterium]|nr:metal-dependent transcriptional regulator [Chloroflexota bacterium]
MREYKVTSVGENYLLSIYVLQEEGIRVTLTQLVEQLKRTPVTEGLGTSLPSVAAMVRRLAREGLVRSNSNKEIVLTPKGQQIAETTVRRHRLAERMVTELLGLELHKAHIEAHRLEHAISLELEEKIFQRLGRPTTCPFGHPIPGSNYSPPPGRLLTLNQSQAGESYVIDRIPEEDFSLLEYLVKSHVIPGQVFSVKEAAPYRGVITLEVEERDVAIGYHVASRIWVRQE